MERFSFRPQNVSFLEAKLNFSQGNGTTVHSDVCPKTYFSLSKTYNCENYVLVGHTRGQGIFATLPGRTLKSSAKVVRFELSARTPWNHGNVGFP